MPKNQSQPPVAEPRSPGRWSQDRRLEFIDFRLRWEGKLNRADLTKHFAISVPQASLDIAKYLELAPFNMTYDKSGRAYLAAAAFKPLYASSDASQYLNALWSTQSGILAAEASFAGWRPSVGLVPTPGRRIDGDILEQLVTAIREHRAVSIVYQSMAQEGPEQRSVSPHAIAHDGFRWHARAYCHLRNQYRDFVIARIMKIKPSTVTYAEPDEDKSWANVVDLELTPNPNLSAALQRVIEMDYGMTRGKVVLACRQALLFYALEHLGLDQQTGRGPAAHQIVLANRSEIEPLLASR